jgi:hypothetical protein
MKLSKIITNEKAHELVEAGEALFMPFDSIAYVNDGSFLVHLVEDSLYRRKGGVYSLVTDDYFEAIERVEGYNSKLNDEELVA